MEADEIQKRELERLEKKKQKQDERLKKMEEKRKVLNENEVGSEQNHIHSLDKSNSECSDLDQSFEEEIDVVEEKKKVCAFSIDRLLEEPKVPRGRRPNSKYPRLQASKSIPSLGIGILPLYPITQPIGFVVEQRQDETKSDTDIMDNSVSSEEGNDMLNTNVNVQSTISNGYADNQTYDSDSEDIDVTDDELH